MTSPRVAAVIPVRDGERFLGAAIESVLAQDYEPIELVVVDDGSRDASLAIARKYPGVRVITNQRSEGLSATRNKGVSATRSDLVAFLDADDLWTPTKLSTQVAALLAEPSAGFALGYERVVLEPGASEPLWVRVARLDAEHVAHGAGAMLVWRTTFDQVGPFGAADQQHAETADWFLRAAELGVEKIVVPEVVMLRRIHGMNMTGGQATARHGVLRAIKASLDRRREAAR